MKCRLVASSPYTSDQTFNSIFDLLKYVCVDARDSSPFSTPPFGIDDIYLHWRADSSFYVCLSHYGNDDFVEQYGHPCAIGIVVFE